MELCRHAAGVQPRDAAANRLCRWWCCWWLLSPPSAQSPSSDVGSFLWPSSLLLSEYIHNHMRDELQGKTVLELGAGRCLSGIHCALLGCRRVLLTDADPAVLRDAAAIVRLNGLSPDQADVRALSWGSFGASVAELRRTGGVDLLIGADVLYEPRDFEAVLATVAFFDRPLLTAYQHRGEGLRRLRQLARKWNFIMESIDFEFEHDDSGVSLQLLRFSPIAGSAELSSPSLGDSLA